MAAVRDRRRAGWSDEIAFWDHWLRRAALNWPEDYRRKTEARPCPGFCRATAFLPAAVDPGCRQRPVSRRHPSGSILVPVDPLADEYNALLDRHGVSPPVRTRPCPAESVADVLGEARFDLVYCQNALDHTEEPLAGLEQMVRAVKPGRWVLLKHVIDEGEHEGYGGLHDWNFRIEDGRFVIWNRETRIYPDERLPLAASVEADLVDEEGYTWVRVGIRRRAD